MLSCLTPGTEESATDFAFRSFDSSREGKAFGHAKTLQLFKLFIIFSRQDCQRNQRTRSKTQKRKESDVFSFVFSKTSAGRDFVRFSKSEFSTEASRSSFWSHGSVEDEMKTICKN